MTRIHELKCYSEYFSRIQSGQKTFEIRKNDRDYQVGDILILTETNRKDRDTRDMADVFYPSHNQLRAKVVYLTNYAQVEGYVVLGIRLMQEGEE